MQVKEKPVSTAIIWTQTWQQLAAIRKPCLQVSFCGLFLPVCLIGLLLACWSGPVVDQIKKLTNDSLALGHTVSYDMVVGLCTGFVGAYLGLGLVVVCLAIASFYAVVRLCVGSLRGELPSAIVAFREGLAFVFPRGLLLLVLVALCSGEELVFGPFFVVRLFALMTPVLMITENRGTLSALKNAVLLRYCSPTRGGAFATAFVLLTLSAILYALQSALHYTTEFLLRADEILGLPRSIWAVRVANTPFSPVYGLTSVLNLGVQVTTWTFLAGFMVCLFFNVRPKISHRI